jgi:hypothetical protein
MPLEEDKLLVRRYYEAMWNRLDFARADEPVTERVAFRGSLSQKSTISSIICTIVFGQRLAKRRRRFPRRAC